MLAVTTIFDVMIALFVAIPLILAAIGNFLLAMKTHKTVKQESIKTAIMAEDVKIALKEVDDKTESKLASIEETVEKTKKLMDGKFGVVLDEKATALEKVAEVVQTEKTEIVAEQARKVSDEHNEVERKDKEKP